MENRIQKMTTALVVIFVFSFFEIKVPEPSYPLDTSLQTYTPVF